MRPAASWSSARRSSASSIWSAGTRSTRRRRSSRVLELDADEADARELRARVRMERKEYAEALADLKAIPAERLAKDPRLAADLFVCESAVKHWPAARALLAQIPEELRARPD